MWKNVFRKTLAKLALILPFTSLITSCGLFPVGPIPPSTARIDVSCVNCEVLPAGAEKRETEIHLTDFKKGETVNFTFFPNRGPESEVSYNLPEEIDVKVNNQPVTTTDYKYNSTNGSFSMVIKNNTAIKVEATDKFATVLFYSSKDALFLTKTVEIGEKVSNPGTPQQKPKPDDEFSGWFEATGDMRHLYAFSEPVYKNTSIIARWQTQGGDICPVTFIFNDDRGSKHSQDAHYGETINKPAPPVWEGHEFVNWRKGLDPASDIVVFPYTVESTRGNPLIFYGEWKLVQYDITFHRTNDIIKDAQFVRHAGQDEIQFKKIDYGTKLTKIIGEHQEDIEITSVGHDFLGWSLASNNQNPVTDEDILKGDTDLYPVFEVHLFTITFEANGGYWVDGQDQRVSKMDIECPYNEIPTIENPKRLIDEKGYEYEFNGWSPEIEKATQDTTYVAQWKSNLIDCVITFNANGGQFPDTSPSDEQKVSFKYSTEFKKIDKPIPMYTGHTFANEWSWDKENKQIISPDDPIGTYGKKAYTVYAKYTVNEYTVHFDTQGGSSVPDQKVPYQGLVTRPETDPTKEGYKFVGWFLQTEGGDPYDFSTPMGASDLVIFAQWQALSYKVTLDPDGGTAVPPELILLFGTLLKPELDKVTVTKSGFDFDHWIYSDTGEEVGPDDTMPARPITLKAIYTTNKYTLTFYANGGIGSIEKNYDFGTPWSEIKNDAPDVQREGHVFKFWSLDEAGQEIPSTWSMPAKDTVIYAIWDIAEYEVTLDGNGGHWGQQTTITRPIYYGHKWGAVIDNGDPKRDGHQFLYYKSTSGHIIDRNEHFQKPNDYTEIQAVWKILQYQVTFDSQGGSEVSPQTIDWGGHATRPDNPTKEGYYFANWYLNKEGTGDPYDFDTATVTSNLVLYAKWEKNRHSVTFDPNGGTLLPTTCTPFFEDVEVGTKISTLPNAPTGAEMTGYDHVGWEVNGQQIDYNTYTMPDEDIIIKPMFDVHVCVVRFWDGETELTSLIQEVNYGEYAIRPESAPEKTGYTFDNWYTDITYTVPFSFETTPITIDNTNIFAKYIPNTYTNTLDANGGKFDDGGETREKIMTFGDKVLSYIGVDDEPTKDGYHFMGWKYKVGEEEKDVTDDTLVEDGVMTYYASWEVNDYIVKFVTNGGSPQPPDIGVKHGATIKEAPEVTLTGYDLEGWYTDPSFTEGSKFIFGDQGTPVTSDLTLYAKWTKHIYTINFLNYDGTIFDTQQVEYEAMPTDPVTPTNKPVKPDDPYYTYEFVGWDHSIESATKDENYEPVFEATAKEYTITFNYRNSEGEAQTDTQVHAFGDTLTPPETAQTYSDDTYIYTFDRWSPTIAPVSADQTYTAQYTRKFITFHIVFKNGDQVLQESDVIKGVLPEYTGETPTKQEEGHSFEFLGWDKEIKVATENTTYNAVFDENVGVVFHGVDCNVEGAHDFATSIPFKSELSIYISADMGFVLPDSIEVYCDGNILTPGTDYTYDFKTGLCYIGNAKGNILIKATGV